MAGPKAQTPAPIDRPLARAYLREFSGWSTAYPPGLSDPTSLRAMENVQVNRDGSLRIRPGLRYLSYEADPYEIVEPGLPITQQPVGSHEAFFLNDGSKAYLFAVREPNGTVGFRVLQFSGGAGFIRGLTAPGINFSVPQGLDELAFSAATTYVKYLQIDNKIFALSDAGETMRLFNVGESKSAKRLASIEVPDWTVDDKLQVVHPEAAWIPGNLLSTRTNRLNNPAFETNVAHWSADSVSKIDLTAAASHTGDRSMQVTSLPQRTNLLANPLTNVPAHGIWGWGAGSAMSSAVASGSDLLAAMLQPGGSGYVNGPGFVVQAGKAYKFAVDLIARTNMSGLQFLVRWYNASGGQIGSDVLLGSTTTVGRKVRELGTAPSGATGGRIYIRLVRTAWSGGNPSATMRLRNAIVCLSDESSAVFSGASGTNFFWLGTAGRSVSVYHAPVTTQIYSNRMPVAVGGRYIASAYFRAATVARGCYFGFSFYNAAGALMGTIGGGSAGNDTNADWTRYNASSIAAPAGAATCQVVLGITNLPRGEVHYIDDVLAEQGTTLADYFSGATVGSPTEINGWTGAANASPSTKKTYSAAATIPGAETKTANTLISNGTNDYNFGFFYSFSNEVGESAMSQVTTLRAARAWGQWRWELPNAAGEPGGTATPDPVLAADQLVAIMPEDVWDAARVAGALSWTLYMLTWSNQDSVPVEGVKLASVELTPASTYASSGWARMTPQQIAGEGAAIPQAANRYNYSNPSRGGQGLVAADRMVLVKDPTIAAVIKWTSNQQGDYTNFSASKGGGYKTLTSGNLFIPAVVKLWQNPQSADTLTILCTGTDGHSTGYYMSPAQVVSQSDTVNVMGFEETTATPGTSSPYGCEVFNNALYHPLDEQLMKSTASNYNINHKSLTDQIENRWADLTHKDQIVSSQLDGRLYFIVNNPGGQPLEAGQFGNELWVFDAASENGTWSRWLIQGHSLRKIEIGGKTYMSIVCKDGIYYLDPEYDRDDFVVGPEMRDDYPIEEVFVAQRFIPWQFETNTQGANRAHDAWARIKQMEINLGNFEGSMIWGMRSWDQYGQVVEKHKIFRQLDDTFVDDGMPWDVDDQLGIDRDLRQWFFYARSMENEDGEVLHSTGQVNAVQYRYAPISVNVGYEHGSIETFEYGRASVNWDQRTTDAGIPIPFNDQRRP